MSAVAACGDETSFRPVEVDLQGVRAEVARVTALWFRGLDRDCTDFAGRDPRTLDADERDAWSPDDAERRLQIPAGEGEEAVLLIFTEDAAQSVLQCVCRPVRYADFERPELVIRLEDGGC